MSAADFHAAIMAALVRCCIQVHIDESPNELPDPIRFAESALPSSKTHERDRAVNPSDSWGQARTTFLVPDRIPPAHCRFG
jgi:hypothetical protein